MGIHHLNIVAPDRVPEDALKLLVLHVGDGDGFRTKMMQRNGVELDVMVRFGFIDAPEMSQRGGPEARDFLKALIHGKVLDVAITSKTGTGTCVDRYGRLVGVPYLTETSAPAPAINPVRKVFGQRRVIVRNIELEVVRNGWAWVLDRYGPHGEYRVAQEEARRLRRGIWAYDSNLSPWAYKQRVRDGIATEERHLAKPRERQKLITGDDCPRRDCDGHVKPRHGRHGFFWGCSNFPSCKFSSNQ